MAEAMTRRQEWVALLVLMLAAAFFRLHQLPDVPPGLTHDEAGHGHDAIAIRDGARPMYQTVGYGREPLFDYLLAGWIRWVGVSVFTLRLFAAFLSLLLLSAGYRWTAAAFDRPTALTACGLMAVSFWPVSTGRQILRSGLLPLLFTGAVYAFWQLTRRDRLSFPLLALFALCSAGCIYTYLPGRILWVVFPLFALIMRPLDRCASGRAWRALLVGLPAAAALVAPMFAYLHAHPEVEQRLAMLGEPLDTLLAGDVSGVLNRAAETLASWVLPGRGDRFLAYTIPGRPVFDPLTGLLFILGLLVAARRWRRPACALALVWFLIGISPSLLTGVDASSTRSIAAIAVAYLFPALATISLLPRVLQRATHRLMAVALLLVLTGTWTYRDYFIQWGQSPEVRAAYRHTTVAAARFLNGEPAGGTVVVSTVYPAEPHDPYIAQLVLSQGDLSLRWVDARAALLLPDSKGLSTRLLVPASTPLDPYFAALPGLSRSRRIEMRADDLNPYFDVIEWEPAVSLEALLEPARAWQRQAEPPLPADFGSIRLIAYDLLTPVVEPAGTLGVVTFWRVVSPPASDLVLYTHALGAAGAVVGQQDRLDAPSWDWRTGDVVGQIHRFALPSDLVAGSLSLEVGAYRRSDLVRLPVANGGDRVLLAPVEVVAP